MHYRTILTTVSANLPISFRFGAAGNKTRPIPPELLLSVKILLQQLLQGAMITGVGTAMVTDRSRHAVALSGICWSMRSDIGASHQTQ